MTELRASPVLSVRCPAGIAGGTVCGGLFLAWCFLSRQIPMGFRPQAEVVDLPFGPVYSALHLLLFLRSFWFPVCGTRLSEDLSVRWSRIFRAFTLSRMRKIPRLCTTW